MHTEGSGLTLNDSPEVSFFFWLLLLTFLLFFFKKTELVEKTGTAKSLLWKETPQSPPQPQSLTSSLSLLPCDGQGEPGGETANSPRPVWPLTKGPHVDGPGQHSPRRSPEGKIEEGRAAKDTRASR